MSKGTESPFWPATNLREPETEYVRGRIRGLGWEDRERVELLLKIERWATEGASGMADGLHSQKVRQEHPEAWEAITDELGYNVADERHRRWEAARDARHAEMQTQREGQVEGARELWEALGGAP